MNIKGEKYFVVEKSGYVWKGKTTLFTAIGSYGEAGMVKRESAVDH